MPPHGRFWLTCLLLTLPLSAQGESPRTDHYGDPLPKDARFRLGTVRLRHNDIVTALAWLPDGRTLASAGANDTVRLWQIPGGKQIAKWEKMPSVAFSADGRTLTCAESEKLIRFCDVATGKELRRLRVPKANVFFGAISPDGKFLVGVEEVSRIDEFSEGEEAPKVCLYAVDTGKVRVLEDKGSLESHGLAFSPDGQTLALALRSGGIGCWQTATGKKRKVLGDSKISALAFSPDDKMLAAIISDKGRPLVCLWSWPAGKELRRLNVKDEELEALAFSPDSKVLAAGGRGNFHLWNPATGEELRPIQGHEASVMDLRFSPDGSLLASAGADGAITVWEVPAKKPARPLTGVGHQLTTVAMTSDGRKLLTGARDGALTLWDGRDGHRLRTLDHSSKSPVSFLLVTPDGRRALEWPVDEEGPSWRDLATGQRLPALPGLTERIKCAAFSPDGSMLALCGESGTLRVWGTSKEKELRRLPRSEESIVGALAWSPDGRTLGILRWNDTVTLWDVKKNRLHHRLVNHRLPYNTTKVLAFPYTQMLAYSPDSRLLAVASVEKHTIRLYETASGQEVRQLRGHPALVRSLAFASDNRTLASGGGWSRYDPDGAAGPLSFDNPLSAIRLWDVPTGKPIHLLQGHQGSIHTLTFSPDAASLVSCSHEDNTVLSWDVAAVSRRRPDGKEIATAKLADLWSDLESKDAARAQRAVAELIQAADSALPFLKKVLLPVPPVKTARLTALIADLGHAEFARREKATRELEKIGELAVPALRQVLKEKPSLEMRKRIAALLEAIDEQPSSSEGLRIIRALQVLESIGTPEARRLLEGLAAGAAGARLTEEAKASLTRLARRSAKP